MPGGKIEIGIGDDYSIVMTGPTTPVGTFTMLPRVQARMEFARAVGISPLHVWRLTLLPGGGLVGRTGRDWPRAA